MRAERRQSRQARQGIGAIAVGDLGQGARQPHGLSAVVTFGACAESTHMDVDGPGLDIGVTTPHQIEQLGALENPIRMADEEGKELEFYAKKMERKKK